MSIPFFLLPLGCCLSRCAVGDERRSAVLTGRTDGKAIYFNIQGVHNKISSSSTNGLVAITKSATTLIFELIGRLLGVFVELLEKAEQSVSHCEAGAVEGWGDNTDRDGTQ